MDRIGRLPAMAKVLRGITEKVLRERRNSGEGLPRRYIIQPLCTPEQVVDLDFRLGAWLVQPSLDAITRNGATVHLEPKVMEVLVCLAQHPGEPIAKEKLLQTV